MTVFGVLAAVGKRTTKERQGGQELGILRRIVKVVE